jgi:hypothetical protein
MSQQFCVFETIFAAKPPGLGLNNLLKKGDIMNQMQNFVLILMVLKRLQERHLRMVSSRKKFL